MHKCKKYDKNISNWIKYRYLKNVLEKDIVKVKFPTELYLTAKPLYYYYYYKRTVVNQGR